MQKLLFCEINMGARARVKSRKRKVGINGDKEEGIRILYFFRQVRTRLAWFY